MKAVADAAPVTVGLVPSNTVWLRRRTAAALAVLAIDLAVGCAGPAVTADPQMAASGAVVQSRSSVPDLASHPASAAPTTHPASAAIYPSARRCTSVDLVADNENGGIVRTPTIDAGFAEADDVTLTNRSRTPCLLGGWVGLTMLGVDTITMCGPSGAPSQPSPCGVVQDKTSRRPQTVQNLQVGTPTTYLLNPGQVEPFSVLWNGSLLPDGNVCGDGPAQMAPYQVEIRVPGDDRPVVLIPFRYYICNGRLGVTPIGIRG